MFPRFTTLWFTKRYSPMGFKQLAPTHLRYPTKALLHPSNRTHCSDIPCSKRPCEKTKQHNARTRFFGSKSGEQNWGLLFECGGVCISLFGWELYSDNTIHGTKNIFNLGPCKRKSWTNIWWITLNPPLRKTLKGGRFWGFKELPKVCHPRSIHAA